MSYDIQTEPSAGARAALGLANQMKKWMLKTRFLLAGALLVTGCVVETDGSEETITQANGARARVVIGFQPGRLVEAKALVTAASGQLHHEFGRLSAIVASVPEQALEGLKHNPNVRYVEEDPKREPMGEGDP